jgi:plasmid stability protein
MKTTVDLPDELVRQLKMRAVYEGRSLKDLMAECLRRGLDMDRSSREVAASSEPRLTLRADGLPMFRCREDAAARQTSVRDLLMLEHRLQAEEDLRRVSGSH